MNIAEALRHHAIKGEKYAVENDSVSVPLTLLYWAADEIECNKAFPSKAERMRAALEQIAVVCTDNMDRNCNHRMALDFVRQVANDILNA